MWRIEASRMSSARQREQGLKLPQLGKERSSCQPLHSRTSSRRSALPQSLGSRDSVANAPRLIGNRHQRTTTWPSVQYRLWLEASNLPYCPMQDRPSRDAVAWRAELSKAKKSNAGIIRRPRGKGSLHKLDREKKLEVLSQRIVHVDRSVDDGSSHNWFDAVDFSKPRDAVLSRLPSRMGRHSLEEYLEFCRLDRNTTPVNTVTESHCPTVRPQPLSRPQSGVHCQMLQLRTRVRNPKISLDGGKSRTVKGREFQMVATSKGQFYRDALVAGHLLLSDVSPPPSPPNISPQCRRVHSIL